MKEGLNNYIPIEIFISSIEDSLKNQEKSIRSRMSIKMNRFDYKIVLSILSINIS